jgi:tRNA-Thr(GGU) m(6)t(6)A37 methyltransferase TsaA
MLAVKIEPIGTVRKRTTDWSVLELRPELEEGLHGIRPGDWVQVLYWMHELEPDARRTLKVHPQGDPDRPLTGVFGLRSPMRPNPIGVSNVQVTEVESNRLFVTMLDALDGSPVIDIKCSTKPPR